MEEKEKLTVEETIDALLWAGGDFNYGKFCELTDRNELDDVFKDEYYERWQKFVHWLGKLHPPDIEKLALAGRKSKQEYIQSEKDRIA